MLDNTITHNYNAGIYLSSNETLVKGNNVSDNPQRGIAGYGYNNRIFHNNFINNTNQAVAGPENAWNDVYPSGGNYWSDYNGTDDFWGMNQDLKGYDMIGDTAYVIDEENKDKYPLMTPWRECKPPITEFPDLNGDGQVNIVDISIVALHFGKEFEDRARERFISEKRFNTYKYGALSRI